MTNKLQGNIGLVKAIDYFVCNGYIVSIPLNDTQDYDLVVDKDNIVSRVQVKTTSLVENNAYCVSLRSCGGTKGTTYKTLKNTNIELLFVWCIDDTMYLIPKNIIASETSLSLRKTPSPYTQKNKLDTSKYIV